MCVNTARNFDSYSREHHTAGRLGKKKDLRFGNIGGSTANSLKSILKMLKALAALKYSRHKKSAIDCRKNGGSLIFASLFFPCFNNYCDN